MSLFVLESWNKLAWGANCIFGKNGRFVQVKVMQ